MLSKEPKFVAKACHSFLFNQNWATPLRKRAHPSRRRLSEGAHPDSMSRSRAPRVQVRVGAMLVMRRVYGGPDGSEIFVRDESRSAATNKSCPQNPRLRKRRPRIALKQEAYNLSGLKHDPHCGLVDLGDSASESVSQ
jgi:hypothetical protein